jgi:ABC-2 type transport system permease protein
VFSLELRRLLSYRVDFWIDFAGTVLVQLGLAFFLWRAVFSFRGVERIGGYTFEAMMLYYLLVPLMEKTTRGHEMGFLSREIYDGTLNRYLVYPVDTFGYKYVSHLAVSALAVVQTLAALALYLALFGRPDGVELRLLPMVAGVGAALAASLLYFSLAAALEMVAFWADNVWSILTLFRFAIRLLGGGMIPLALFPEWSRTLLEALPFAYLLSWPIRIFMGQEPVLSTGWLWMAGWTLVAMGLARAVWWRGNLRYTGVGI